MSGYNGFSMSNNAVVAYESGEKPISRWTKSDIIEAIEDAINEEEIILNFSMDKLKSMPVSALRNLCLSYSSWHHTSSHYNRTDFYSLDVDKIVDLTDERIDKIIRNYKKEKPTEPTEERWECAFLEWSGTRKHPKATEIIEEGVVRGNWFFRVNGCKKKITANGFRYIKKIQ